MKKVYLIIAVFLVFVAPSKVLAQITAQQQGFADGRALGEYVITNLVSPNIPPMESFVTIVSSVAVLSGDYGTILTVDYTREIDQASYANACINYAYANGLLVFYRDYIEDVVPTFGNPNVYNVAYLEGYMSRMKGRIRLE